jgi:ADP-ribose pyrophosphatase YjhB (NUDIX family)
MSQLTENIQYEGITVTLTWIPAEEVGDPTMLKPIMQVYGICFDEHDNILLFKNQKGKWTLPGGTTEAGESPLDTLKRELMEEVDIEIEDNPEYVGAQLVHDAVNFYQKGVDHYQIRYACRIKKMHPSTPDPDNGFTYERKLVPHAEVLDYLGWKDKIAPVMFTSAVEKIKNQGK